jgi:tetratricopeptide (TPR) repeat protein
MTRLEQLLRLTQTSPNDPLTHYAVALEYLEQRRYPEAVAAFEQALKIDPDYAPAYYHKARAEIRGDRKADARVTLAAGFAVARRFGDRKTAREMGELLESIR